MEQERRPRARRIAAGAEGAGQQGEPGKDPQETTDQATRRATSHITTTPPHLITG